MDVKEGWKSRKEGSKEGRMSGKSMKKTLKSWKEVVEGAQIS